MSALISIIDPKKFKDANETADGQARARVPFVGFQTLWFNTGTLCNLECGHCYIESSPTNDRLSFLSIKDVEKALDELNEIEQLPSEIGFTGGEPFANPAFLDILEITLTRGYAALVLTNAMRPMQRPRTWGRFKSLVMRFPGMVSVRVSLDHFDETLHDGERGSGSWNETCQGVDLLNETPVLLSLAGRTKWTTSGEVLLAGYQGLAQSRNWTQLLPISERLVLFPEMDETLDVPEISTACWDILGKMPEEMMCASSRMVIRRRGHDEISVVACTLLPYEAEFDYGPSIAAAQKETVLNHPHCARFCVLGGASCSK